MKIREISFMKILKFRILAFLHLSLFKIIKSFFQNLLYNKIPSYPQVISRNIQYLANH